MPGRPLTIQDIYERDLPRRAAHATSYHALDHILPGIAAKPHYNTDEQKFEISERMRQRFDFEVYLQQAGLMPGGGRGHTARTMTFCLGKPASFKTQLAGLRIERYDVLIYIDVVALVRDDFKVWVWPTYLPVVRAVTAI